MNSGGDPVKAGAGVAVGQADPWVGEPNPDTPLVAEPGMRSRVARGTLVNAAFHVGLSAIGLLKGFIVAGFLTTDGVRRLGLPRRSR